MNKKFFAVLLSAILVLALGSSLLMGGILTSPASQQIGAPPNDLKVEAVEFQSGSGSSLHGWFLPGSKGVGAVVLMHGVRSNRLSMLDRARFLNSHGFAILMFDFQAHGESQGKHITFGYLESKDAAAAVSFLRSKCPGEKIGVIGVSLGGAAVLLAEPPLSFDAMVLEMVYPTINEAVSNRLTMRMGSWATVLSPLLTWQLKPRLGVSPEQLRPLDHVGNIRAPKLFIAGANDRHTTVEESRKLYDAAGQPKELWIIDKAAHVDLHDFARREYESRVLDFLRRGLATP